MQVQAAVISQFGQPFEVNSLDLAAPSDDEVLVRLAAVGICHSDVACQHGAFALYEAGRCPFDRLIKFYGFGDINRAIAGMHHGTTIKPTLRLNA